MNLSDLNNRSVPLYLLFLFLLPLIYVPHSSTHPLEKKPGDIRYEERRQLRNIETRSFMKPLQKLNLSREQKDEIQIFLQEHRSDTDALRQELSKIKRELTESIPSFNDLTAQGLAIRAGDVMGDILYSDTVIRSSIYRILTPEQREQLIATTIFNRK